MILEKLNEISERLTALEKKIDHIEQSATQMTQHISFVESIYNQIQVPFMAMIASPLKFISF